LEAGGFALGMRQMFGNLSIHPKMVVLLAVPAAGAALLGVTGVAGAWGDRARAAEERREAAVAGQALVAVHELQEERVRAVAWAAGEGGQDELGARRRRVDSALAAYRAGAAGLGPTGDRASTRASPPPPSAWAGWPLSGPRSTSAWWTPSAPGRPWPAWPAAARRWPTASSSCSRTWSGTSPTRNAARACSGSTTSPPGCAAPPRPCSP
jgi:hypothetical protein